MHIIFNLWGWLDRVRGTVTVTPRGSESSVTSIKSASGDGTSTEPVSGVTKPMSPLDKSKLHELLKLFDTQLPKNEQPDIEKPLTTEEEVKLKQ